MQTRTYTAIIIACAAIIAACTGAEEKQWEATSDCANAKVIVDTLWQPDKLDSIALHYRNTDDHASEMLIRQKLGTVMRNRSDFEAAVKILREKGMAATAKKQSRIAAEGIVDILTAEKNSAC